MDPEYDFVRFMQICHEKGMYVTLRLGPFIQAEWNHGYVISEMRENPYEMYVLNYKNK